DRNIDVKVAADERVRLDAELARVLKELDQTGDTSAKTPVAVQGLWLNVLFALAAILPIVSAALYLTKNAPMLMAITEARSRPPEAATAAAPQQVPPMVMQMVGRLEQRLKENPQDPKGWAQLGRAYSVLGRQTEAAQAYARAYQQAPNDKEIVQAYGTYLVQIHPNRLSPEATVVFRRLLQLDPNNSGALWALGLGAYYDNKFSDAIKYWEHLLKQLPPQSDAVADVQRALDAARAGAAGKKTQ